RRRVRVAALLARDAARAGTRVPVHQRDDDDQLLPALRGAVRDDAGRSPAEHDESRAAHVRAGLPLVAARLRRVARGHPVRGHPRGQGDPGAAPVAAGGGGAMRRGLGTWILHALLIGGAALTVAPLLWMVSASLMPTGAANTSPPPLLPPRVTFE